MNRSTALSILTLFALMILLVAAGCPDQIEDSSGDTSDTPSPNDDDDDDDNDDDNDDNDDTSPETGTVRVFAVQLKQDLADCAGVEDFARRMEDLFADEIVPYLSDRHANLVVLPEYAAFTCCFSGSRGNVARLMPDTLSAFIALGAGYGRTLIHLLGAHPGISLRRALFLSLTDAIWRPFFETFSDLAERYNLYLLATTTVADAGLSVDPQDRELFGDPVHPDRKYVYVPNSPHVYNQAVLFDPDGAIALRARKVHLLNDPEQSLMDLTPGQAADLPVYPLFGATVGVAVCWDAWFSDVLSHLKEQGADLLLIPSANAHKWGGDESAWEPDGWYEGPWTAVIQEPGFRFGVNAMLTGNLFDIPFDGQSGIFQRDSHRPPFGYIGTSYRPGFDSLAPWVMSDPCFGFPDLTCRAALMERADALAPGGEWENDYVETVLWADLSFAAGKHSSTRPTRSRTAP